MCLDLTKNSKILIARRDLVTYKWLDTNDYGYDRKTRPLKSHYREQTWKVGEVVTVPVFTNANYKRFISSERVMRAGGKEINQGLHSYSKSAARKHLKYAFWRQLYETVIPKGTRYIRGADGEIVSLALKLVSSRRVKNV